MIRDEVHRTMRIRYAKFGDARIFGEDAPARKKMSDWEAEERFKQVWTDKLEAHVRVAPVITATQARELLEDEIYQKYVIDTAQYRQFLLDQVPIVVRLNRDATEDGVCEQFWPLGAHRDPSRLCIYFDTVAEKVDFDDLSRSLDYHPQRLAMELLMDFMRKHPKR